MAIAIATVWAAIALSYATGYPIGFLVGAISAFRYCAGRLWAAWRRRQSPARALPA